MTQLDRLKGYQSELMEKLPQVEGKKLMVIGDLGLDEYIQGDVRRISPEAPVPVVHVTKEDKRIGLAGNVAANITALGGQAVLLGVVGDDTAKDELLTKLKESGVDASGLVVDPTRPTTRKVRVMTDTQQIVRVDYELKRFLSETIEKQLLEAVDARLGECDALVIEDYAKGLLSKGLTQKLIGLARKYDKLVVVDPHRSTPVEYYVGVDIFKPNRDEAFILSGLNIDELREDGDSLNRVGETILEKVGATHLIVTQGKQGMRLFNDGETLDLPTYARDVFDVTGAGDTVLAALSLGWVSGFGPELACAFANFAAGVVVGHVGCVPCERDELVEYIKSHSL